VADAAEGLPTLADGCNWYFTLWRQHPKQRSAGIDDPRPLSARISRVMRGVVADLRRSRRVSAGGRRTAPKPLTERENRPGVFAPPGLQVTGSAKPQARPPRHDPVTLAVVLSVHRSSEGTA
jgi:hypothetical protein